MTATPPALLDDAERVPTPVSLPMTVALAAWVRGTCAPAGAACVLLGVALHAVPGIGLLPLLALGIGVAGVALLLVGVALSAVSPSARRESETVLTLPLDGRWGTVDDAAPGQGNHAYGQAYALGLAVEAPWRMSETPEGFLRRRLRAAGWRPSAESPTFGQPVRAVADATVVAVVDSVRDHRARTSRLARMAGSVGGAVRELRGTRAVLGNHVVLDLGAGRFALCAHLQHGSVGVRVGDRVLPGDVLASVGTSGASNEPHLHVQVMDSPRPRTAAGLPMRLVALDPIWR